MSKRAAGIHWCLLYSVGGVGGGFPYPSGLEQIVAGWFITRPVNRWCNVLCAGMAYSVFFGGSNWKLLQLCGRHAVPLCEKPLLQQDFLMSCPPQGYRDHHFPLIFGALITAEKRHMIASFLVVMGKEMSYFSLEELLDQRAVLTWIHYLAPDLKNIKITMLVY